jgi:hypothetical protein
MQAILVDRERRWPASHDRLDDLSGLRRALGLD